MQRIGYVACCGTCVMWSERTSARTHSPHPSRWYSRFVPSLHLPNESIDGCVILFDFFLCSFSFDCVSTAAHTALWLILSRRHKIRIAFIHSEVHAEPAQAGSRDASIARWISECAHGVSYILCIIIRCGTAAVFLLCALLYNFHVIVSYVQFADWH